MSTIALPHTTTKLPARAKVAAGVALPLGLMNLVGVVIFWDWSWLTWVGVLGAVMAVATLAGAVNTLRDRVDGRELLRKAMVAQLGFTAFKLVFWQELEALTFGAVALALYLALRD